MDASTIEEQGYHQPPVPVKFELRFLCPRHSSEKSFFGAGVERLRIATTAAFQHGGGPGIRCKQVSLLPLLSLPGQHMVEHDHPTILLNPCVGVSR